MNNRNGFVFSIILNNRDFGVVKGRLLWQDSKEREIEREKLNVVDGLLVRERASN